MKNTSRIATILLVLQAFIMSGFLSPAVAAASEKQASAYISDVSTKAIDIIKNKSLDKSKKAELLVGVFNTSVDFPWVSRFVMGRYWRDATADQRTRYSANYQKFLVLHYASLFSEYTGGTYKILYSRSEGDNEFTVGSQIQSVNVEASEPILIDYKVRADAKNKFKIFDVIIEGVSMLSTQRTEFSSILNSKGVDYLNDQLEKKAASIASK